MAQFSHFTDNESESPPRKVTFERLQNMDSKIKTGTRAEAERGHGAVSLFLCPFCLRAKKTLFLMALLHGLCFTLTLCFVLSLFSLSFFFYFFLSVSYFEDRDSREKNTYILLKSLPQE